MFSLQIVAHRFAQTFDKEEDVQNLSNLFTHDVILQNVGKLFEAIGSIDKVIFFKLFRRIL